MARGTPGGAYDFFCDRLSRMYFCEGLAGLSVRCTHPIQQHGRRLPLPRSAIALSTCFARVSGFLTEIVQQIHSLRASGVRPFHVARASGWAASAFRMSAGTPCATPAAMFPSFIGVTVRPRRGCRNETRGRGDEFKCSLAERVGFEPTNPCGLPLFKSGAFNHSATSPWRYACVSYAGRHGYPTLRVGGRATIAANGSICRRA